MSIAVTFTLTLGQHWNSLFLNIAINSTENKLIKSFLLYVNKMISGN